MYDHRDPRGRALAANLALWVFLVSSVAQIGLSATVYLIATGGADPSYGATVDRLFFLLGIVNIACMVFVARWIYRASWNAHALSDGLSVSPGWAIGWYFVPIANFFKPYQAMKEIWSASFNRWDGYTADTPPILGWWWGLWVITAILGNTSLRLAMSEDFASVVEAVTIIDILACLLSVPLVFILQNIIAKITEAQATTRYEETFA